MDEKKTADSPVLEPHWQGMKTDAVIDASGAYIKDNINTSKKYRR